VRRIKMVNDIGMVALMVLVFSIFAGFVLFCEKA